MKLCKYCSSQIVFSVEFADCRHRRETSSKSPLRKQPPPCDITWLGPASARRALASYVSLAASLSSPHFFYLLPTSCPTFQDRGRFSFLSSSICSKREVLYAIRCFILFLFHSVLIFRWGNCFIINFVEIEIKCIIFHPNLRCNKLPKKNVSSILQ